MLQIYNSITKTKLPFTPITPNKIGMYLCGVTVYDHCHLGHARTYVAFDVITRYLQYRGYEVNQVRNITDIDDKIINRAIENNEDYKALTERMTESMHDDFKALNILPPTSEPRATEHFPEMISIIETLIQKDIAYASDNGDVYYDVTQFKDYGRLAKKDIEGQEAGARIDIVSVKRNPLDFVLWKAAKPNEPSWDSPWGMGRPGWHIECSAMSKKCLGETFDIHGGGADLQFPHHENEIAQSEGASGKTFVNTWMHCGFLQINREKMSKSLNNFFTIKEVLKQYKPEVIRYFLMSSHYRSQLNYSLDNLNNAKNSLERFYYALKDLDINAAQEANENNYEQRFIDAMNDDFNTPEALAVLFDMTHQINHLRENDVAKAAALAKLLIKLGQTLGFLNQTAENFFQGDANTDLKKKVEALIADRKQARTEKDWGRADAIREEIAGLGIELEDTSSGTQWRIMV